jgi:3-oxoacyl-[acyl-carrier-protein] synthase-3
VTDAVSPVEDQGVTRRPGLSVADVAVRGIVSALPHRRVTNEVFLERFGEGPVADVVKMVGVEARYWVDESQTTADLCQAAAERLLERLAWTADSVDALIFVSQTPDHRMPATACVLHGKLGLSPTCQAFDVGQGCSGYVYGLWLASALLKAGCKRIVLLAGDTISRIVDPNDRGTALLFGDAGTATALEFEAGAPALTFVLGTDGGGARNLIVQSGGFRPFMDDPRMPEGFDRSCLFMDGGEVFTFTLRAVPKLVNEALAGAGLAIGDLDALIAHQANRFMLRHIGKKVGIDPERMPINIDRYGNTSSASIPLVMTTDLAERVTGAPSLLMTVGFGVGYSWGAAVLPLAPLACAETLVL